MLYSVLCITMGILMVCVLLAYARTNAIGENNLFPQVLISMAVIAMTVYCTLNPSWWSVMIMAYAMVTLKYQSYRELESKSDWIIYNVYKRRITRYVYYVYLAGFAIGVITLYNDFTWYSSLLWAPLILWCLRKILLELRSILKRI